MQVSLAHLWVDFRVIIEVLKSICTKKGPSWPSIYYEMVWGCQGTPSNHGARKLLTGPFKSNTANVWPDPPSPRRGGTVKNHPVYCFWSCFNPSRFLNMYSCIPPCHNNPSFQPAIASINLVAGVYGRNCHLQRQNFYFYKQRMIFSLKQKLEN